MKLTKLQLVIGFYFGFWVSYFAWFWRHVLHFDAMGNLMAGHVNIWGDWAAHFTMGSAMGYRQLWLVDSPFIIGQLFSYPFITNLISALFIRLNVPFLWSFIIPSFLCSCLVIFAIFYFYRTVFKSVAVAILASLLLLLNGGVGFVYFAQDIIQSPQPLYTLINPPHEYTRIDNEQIKWISIIDSMVIPQRAFALGFPLTLLALSFIYQRFFYQPAALKFRRSRLLFATVILGFMPLIHTHSFLAAGVILAVWSLVDIFSSSADSQFSWWASRFNQAKPWLAVAGGVVVIALPLYLYFFSHQVDQFIQWYPGWLAKEYDINWLLFWFKNWGLTPLVGIVGSVVYLKQSSSTTSKNRVTKLAFIAPFWALFIACNLVLFQPFSWDNTKLLVWASVGISGLAAWLIIHRWRPGSRMKRVFLGLVLASMIASGTIDAYWDIRADLHSYQLYSAEELELADWVKTNTPVEAVWLTSDRHNHWLFNLTGRQPVMAYRGWLWTHGYDYQQVEKDVTGFFKNPANVGFITRYQISFVVVGEHERSEWRADEEAFRRLYRVIKETETYTLFDVSSPATSAPTATSTP